MPLVSSFPSGEILNSVFQDLALYSLLPLKEACLVHNAGQRVVKQEVAILPPSHFREMEGQVVERLLGLPSQQKTLCTGDQLMT